MREGIEFEVANTFEQYEYEGQSPNAQVCEFTVSLLSTLLRLVSVSMHELKEARAQKVASTQKRISTRIRQSRGHPSNHRTQKEGTPKTRAARCCGSSGVTAAKAGYCILSMRLGVVLLLVGAVAAPRATRIQRRGRTPKPAYDRTLSLHEIALQEHCSKASFPQQYTHLYPTWLEHWRDRNFNLLELGVGNADTPSLRMWDRYFSHATIFGSDCCFSGPRILAADQEKSADLQRLASFRNWSLVIEDASHAPRHQLASFLHLFPGLAAGGVYIVEDIETQWWATLPYGIARRPNEPNVVGMFQRAARDVLQAEYLCETPKPVFSREIDDMIASIAFVSNAIIVTKRPAMYTRKRERDLYRFKHKLECEKKKSVSSSLFSWFG